MSRDEGFAVADVSVNLYDDDRVKRLYRELGGDLGRMGHAMMLAEVTLLASWRDGKRLTVHQAAPLWLTVDDELVAALVRVGMLDRGHRRPLKSWQAWFGPAYERREKRRRAGALGGRPPKDPENHPVINRKPRPSVRPSVRPPGARAREAASSNDAGTNGRGMTSLAELVDPAVLAAIGRRPA